MCQLKIPVSSAADKHCESEYVMQFYSVQAHRNVFAQCCSNVQQTVLCTCRPTQPHIANDDQYANDNNTSVSIAMSSHTNIFQHPAFSELRIMIIYNFFTTLPFNS